MNNKGADQPVHPCNLIRAFVVHCLDSIIQILADNFKMSKFSKGHNSGKISSNTFLNILLTRFHPDFSKGHNARKGDNWDKKKNTVQLFFYEESIYEISKP